MIRDWQIVKEILINVENNSLREFFSEKRYLNLISDSKLDDEKILEVVLGHFEILLDAGILKNGEITRRSDGSFEFWDFQGIYISMFGHDLLDALRDKTIWEKIKRMSKRSGASLSWEFIKAAIPIAIQQALKNVS